jgi:hypothetical protein
MKALFMLVHERIARALHITTAWSIGADRLSVRYPGWQPWH